MILSMGSPEGAAKYWRWRAMRERVKGDNRVFNTNTTGTTVNNIAIRNNTYKPSTTRRTAAPGLPQARNNAPHNLKLRRTIISELINPGCTVTAPSPLNMDLESLLSRCG